MLMKTLADLVAYIYSTKLVLMLRCLVAVACQEVNRICLGIHPFFCQQWAGDCFHAMLAGVYRRDVAFRLVSDRKAVAQLFTTVASHFRELYNLHVTVSTDA